MLKLTPLAVVAALLLAAPLPGCTSAGQIDTVKVQADIKTACGIAVQAASIISIFKLDPTMSISAVVNLICSSFNASVAGGKEGARDLKSGTSVTFPVKVNGETVQVTGTVV